MLSYNFSFICGLIATSIIGIIISLFVACTRPKKLPTVVDYIVPTLCILWFIDALTAGFATSSALVTKEIDLNNPVKGSNIYVDVVPVRTRYSSYSILKYVDEDGYEKKFELDECVKVKHKTASKNKLSYTRNAYYNIFGEEASSTIATITIYEKTSE